MPKITIMIIMVNIVIMIIKTIISGSYDKNVYFTKVSLRDFTDLHMEMAFHWWTKEHCWKGMQM